MTFLLTWNPARWSFETYAEGIAATTGSRPRAVTDRWSIGSRRNVEVGERVFLLRQGIDRRGIVAAGHTTSTAFQDAHWDGSPTSAWYAAISFDRLVDPDDRVPTEILEARIPTADWHPRGAGQRLDVEETATLEALWAGEVSFDHLGQRTNGFAAEAGQDAADLARRLLGVQLRSFTGRRYSIVAVNPPTVLVVTDLAPRGRSRSLTELQRALESLREHDLWPPDDDSGRRSGFVEAVLRTLPGIRRVGDPPLLRLGRPLESPEQVDDEQVGFEGPLNRRAVGAARGEQRALRTLLFSTRTHDLCALCGQRYPVEFLHAAHIKPRAVCTDDEKRDLAHIAMRACTFGCDALFEHGYVAIDPTGMVITTNTTEDIAEDTAVSPALDALARHLAHLAGRECGGFNLANQAYFAWHHDNVFRGAIETPY